jgi:hypothetical protein
MTFLAAVLLASRDASNYRATMRSARRHLLASPGTSNDEFASRRPFAELPLLLKTRTAIATYFDVPVEQVDRDVALIDDLHVDKLEPSFQYGVVNSVIASTSDEPHRFWFSMKGLSTIDDLASAIQRVIDGFDEKSEN